MSCFFWDFEDYFQDLIKVSVGDHIPNSWVMFFLTFTNPQPCNVWGSKTADAPK